MNDNSNNTFIQADTIETVQTVARLPYEPPVMLVISSFDLATLGGSQYIVESNDGPATHS